MVQREKTRWIAEIVVAYVLWNGASLAAETLQGKVLDPQQRPIVGANVSLTCGQDTDTRSTDHEGSFTFTRETFPVNCRVRAVYPSFAALETRLGRQRILTLQLRLAAVHQSVSAKDDLISPESLSSVSLSEAELRKISNDSTQLVAYAKQLAGVFAGSDHIYVDGLPADQPPPSDRIESITINPDPFSAEYSDGSDTHIDILTKNPDRKFHLSTGGISLGPPARDGLDPQLKSSSNAASIGASGAVPSLPLVFITDVSFNDKDNGVPIEAVVPVVQQYPITSVNSALASDSNLLVGLGADYSKGESLHVNTMSYAVMSKNSNVGVSSLTLPEAGVSSDTNGREVRVTISKTDPNYVYRAGIVANRLDKELHANSDSLGVGVSGAFVAGGAQISKANTLSTRWTLKNVVQFKSRNHYWTIGAETSRRGDTESIDPNPIGFIQFAGLQDYVNSATTGAATGTGFITRGDGDAYYRSYTAAPFVETEIFRRSGISVRGGLRGDYQTSGGFAVSPRLSAVAVFRGFLFRVGTGMFVHDWTNDIFLRMIENDGKHLQQFLITNASLSSMDQAGIPSVPQIVSEIGPNFTPIREWVSKFSVEHPFGNFVPGLEYTWTDGTHLLGSQRLSTPTGWTDVLESNRALQKQQVHLKTRYRIGHQSLTAHYEWILARNDTDGPFSFPARQSDIQGEWGPVTGISRHNLTVAANVLAWKENAVTILETWRSSMPVNITSGVDVEGNGLYTDRAGLPRNSGHGPSFNSFDVYAHRRVPVPVLFSEGRQKMYVDLGVQAANLFQNSNYTAIGTVLNSPSFSQPLASLPGRSFRFSLRFSR
jgi:hypothetical protein